MGNGYKAVWDVNGVSPGLSLVPSIPAATHPPPCLGLVLPHYGKEVQHIKKGLKLLSLSHLELILLHHELQSRRSITAHLHIFH